MHTSHDASISNDTPVTRIATIGFAPASRLNVPTAVFYTDVDNTSGERSHVPVSTGSSKRSQEEMFDASLKMILLELSYELNIDPANPPSWVPNIDDALDANLMLTEGDLYDRLLEEITNEKRDGLSNMQIAVPSRAAMPTCEGMHDLPHLLSEISLAFGHIETQENTDRLCTNLTDAARETFIQQVVDRVQSPIPALKRMFDVRSLDLGAAKLRTVYVDVSAQSEPIGAVDNLLVATALAWTTNLTTSNRYDSQKRVGFCLCNENDEPISKSITLDLTANDGGIRFDLNLADTLGRAELAQMNLALEKLAEISGRA